MAQPSMSKAGQLLQCSWAFNNPAVPRVTANEYMRYGSGYHELQALSLDAGIPPKLSLKHAKRIARRYDIDEAELRAHAAPAYEKLYAWLSGANPWKTNLLPVPKGALVIEKSVAVHVPTGEARFIANPDEHHIYQEAGPDDHPGTVDIALDLGRYGKRVPDRLRDAVLVLDHKTGLTFDQPRENAQLKSLALAFTRIWKRKRGVLGIVHAHRETLPEVYVDEVHADVLEAHLCALQPAFARIGDGSMRPGSACDWCAGNSVCPTRGGSLVQIASLVTKPDEDALVETAREKLGIDPLNGRQYIDLDTAEGAGLAHMIIQFCRKVDEDWTARIKANIRGGMIPIRPDGKLLDLQPRKRENLSLASLRRALDKKKIKKSEYDKIETRLREIGAIETLEREELRAMDDR